MRERPHGSRTRLDQLPGWHEPEGPLQARVEVSLYKHRQMLTRTGFRSERPLQRSRSGISLAKYRDVRHCSLQGLGGPPRSALLVLRAIDGLPCALPGDVRRIQPPGGEKPSFARQRASRGQALDL